MSFAELLSEFVLGQLLPMSFDKLLNELVLEELLPISPYSYNTPY